MWNARHPRHRATDEDRLHDRPGQLVARAAPGPSRARNERGPAQLLSRRACGARGRLKPGRPFTVTTRLVEGSRDRVSVSYARLPTKVGVGDTLLLAADAILLRVEPRWTYRTIKSRT
jgi:hypothetical protein